MTRRRGCEHLTTEQIEQLTKVGKATGNPNLVDMICARGARDTEALEAAGINYKARKKPHGYGLGDFIRQSREAVAKATESTKVAPAKPTLPKVLDAALAAANANAIGDPGILGSTINRATKASPKPSELTPQGERLAQRVARLLEEQYVKPIRDAVAGIEGGRPGLAARLEEANSRLDVVQGLKQVPPGFLGGDGNRNKGSRFDWAAFDARFTGRAQ